MQLPISPPLPTDNLYKFMALAGLVLFIGAPVYWAIFETRAAPLEIAAIRALLQTVIEKPYDYYVPPPTPTDAAAAKAQAERLARIREKADRADREAAKANVAAAPYFRFHSIVNAVSIVFCVAGFLIAVTGFRLWYERVQRPQDALLAAQVKHAQAGVTSDRGKPLGEQTPEV